MKKINAIGVVLLGVILLAMAGTAYAEENFVTSKKLSINDVKPYLLSHLSMLNSLNYEWKYNCQLTKVFGIHQTDNTARVFYEYSYDKTSGSPPPRKRRSYDELIFVRLNSGKWFNIKYQKYLTK